MILENEQAVNEVKDSEEQFGGFSFATVGSVYEDGISLIFPGETAASQKHYQCNTSCRFVAGQRVYLQKDSGTYIAMFTVGAPNTNLVAQKVMSNDDQTDLIALSANPSTKQYYANSRAIAGWKQLS